MQHRITRTIHRIGATALVALGITALAACADAPTAPRAAPAAPHLMVANCDTPDGCCNGETAIIECGGTGGPGGWTPSGPNNDVKLTWFSDHGPYATDEYYELRHRWIGPAGNEIYYNAQFLHGTAFTFGEFSSLDLGRGFPCGGRIDVTLYKLNIGWFGHVTGAEMRGYMSVYDGTQGVMQSFTMYQTPSGFPPPPPGTQPSAPPAAARWTWPAGTCA